MSAARAFRLFVDTPQLRHLRRLHVDCIAPDVPAGPLLLRVLRALPALQSCVLSQIDQVCALSRCEVACLLACLLAHLHARSHLCRDSPLFVLTTCALRVPRSLFFFVIDAQPATAADDYSEFDRPEESASAGDHKRGDVRSASAGDGAWLWVWLNVNDDAWAALLP